MKLIFRGLLVFLPLVATYCIAQQKPKQQDQGQPTSVQQSPQTAPAGQIPVPTPQTPPQAPVPPGGPQIQPPAGQDYSQEAYVIQEYRNVMRFENDGTGVVETTAKIKVVGESGVQALGQLKFGYSELSDKLEIPYVRVRKPDGTVVTAQESAIQDLTLQDAPVYTDYHEKHISVPSLRPGDILEYKLVRSIVNPLTPGQFWTGYNFTDRGIVLDETLEINVPTSREIKLKTKPGSEPKISEEGDRRVYRWTHSHLQDEDDSASSKKKTPPEDEEASVQLTTFASWEQLGAWYGGLEKDRRTPDAAIKAKSDELVKGKTTDIEKVQALYDFVSRDFRYVSLSFGLGRYQPHAASEVLANGYGDCKDKNTLLASLLQAQGFESTSVLIGSQRRLDPDIPAPYQFDHVITRVPVQGQEVWMDSTSGVEPFRALMFSIRDKQALAIPPKGAAMLVTTPADLPFPSYDRESLAGSLNDTGKLTGHVTIEGRGDTEVSLRYLLRQVPSNRWKEIFQGALERTPMHGGDISNLKVGDPSDTSGPIHIEFDLTVSNYFDWPAAESKLPLPVLGIQLPVSADDDETSDNGKFIKLGPPMDASYEVKLTIPPKYTAQAPIGMDLKRDYAQYHSQYKIDNGQLNTLREVKITMRQIPAERQLDYRSFVHALDADQKQEVSLENKQPGVASAGSDESAEDLSKSGIQALENQNYPLAIQLFQQVVRLEPKSKDAWGRLGNAYFLAGQLEPAISALQKQIEINPYDEYAYNALGFIYQRQGKDDLAIEQFHKQLEINPLNGYSHANLGEIYLRQKKYPEAVSELDKATSIDAKNVVLQIDLGHAYLGLGQTDKGMAAFEKAISMSPTPLTWNNIAYTLSEENVQLDRADKYADQAISGIEDQLRDVTLENLRFPEVTLSHFLFDVWDTKGWIAFQRGDLDTAEKYIAPAWLANGTGDIGEHLGEIYKKRGKRDEAIKLYLQSLAVEAVSHEATAKLAALGVTGDLAPKIEQARLELKQERTTALDAKNAGKGDYFLLISPHKVEQARFIGGDASIKGLTDVVQGTKPQVKFPTTADTRVIQRVTVICGTQKTEGAQKPSGSGKHAKPDKKDAGSSAKPESAAPPEEAATTEKVVYTPGACSMLTLFNDEVRSLD